MRQLLLLLCFAISAAISSAAYGDIQRGIRNYQEIKAGRKKVEQLSPTELREVLDVVEALKRTSRAEPEKPRFEVVAAIRGCKYFVAEQGINHSLVEDWLCMRPSRGDLGYGDIGTFGLKEVTLNGMSCTVYVDDWLLSKSRAIEKMADKCQ